MRKVITDKPMKQIQGLTFFPIPEFRNSNGTLTSAPLSAFFDRYKRPYVPSKYENMASDLFFEGGKLESLQPDVDKNFALDALRYWLSSWAPPHESKITTVGYALWVWSTPAEERG